ncbi:HAD-IIA family hydrolase [Halobellus ordinarius]|uniref:HAD-IIA family hydrolase n=1 Tax=Halobellus ordinarius TaxID=3075120 RepID=UPI0028801080|nr:HAD-IIA family hydrolase [Halobellus sp. ZY16]
MGVRGVIFDVDGTIVRGEQPLEGTDAGLEAVESAGLDRLFVSNNPTKPPEAYEDRLASAGITVDADEIITAGTVTARYLTEQHAKSEIAVVGESGLVDLLRDAGLSVLPYGSSADTVAGRTDGGEAATPPGLDPDVLVASVDRRFDYETLRECLWLLEDPDVTFVGTDPDVVIPAAEGDIPGSGAVIDAIANVAGRDPTTVLGKPSKPARRMALERLGLPPEDVLVVGDRPDTDIAFGNRAGMATALVRTGVSVETGRSSPDEEPDFVLDSLAGLEEVLATLSE